MEASAGGRPGGCGPERDEFVVLLAETPARQALRLAERFRQHISATPAEHDGGEVALSASIGLDQLEADESIESWIERADQALYSAKPARRNQVAFARPPDSLPAHPSARPAVMPTEEASGREAAG